MDNKENHTVAEEKCFRVVCKYYYTLHDQKQYAQLGRAHKTRM